MKIKDKKGHLFDAGGGGGGGAECAWLSQILSHKFYE